MKIAIIGASTDKNRMSNKAIRAYQKNKHIIFPINPKYEEIEGIKTVKLSEIKEKLDIVSVYVKPEIGIKLANSIINSKPGKVILNPGSESDELVKKLKNAGLSVHLICSIRMIGEDPNNF